MSPNILIATTSCWFPTARLGMALARAGFLVDAVCPPDHPICLTSVLRRAYDYRGLNPVRSIKSVIEATKPDLIVSGDDLATLHLHQLHREGEQSGFTRDLIERSLGAPESFDITCDRDAFIELAKEEGIRVPETKPISNVGQLRKWVSEAGFPTVLKASRTSGGAGVRIVHSVDEAERGYRALQAPPLLARALKRAVMDSDRTLVWPSLLRSRHKVQAQVMIVGREATTAVACWRGKVLGSLNFEVLHKRDQFGPATVLQATENPEMLAASAKIVSRLGLSGLHGFDFMVEEESENAYLIEINPRATQVGHLTLGEGRDLPAALYASATGRAIEPSPKVTESSTIALFPHEWIRNPESTFLHSAYHDVPWSEPALVRACVRNAPTTRKYQVEQNWTRAFSVESPSVDRAPTTSGK
jgi:formate-dependent phosphoribosylglycinamide formyltransferase (GAR transformylase)